MTIDCSFSSGPSCRGGAQLDAAEGRWWLSTAALILAAIGLSRLGTTMRWLVAGVCLSQWCFINASDGETQHTWLTRPLPLHDWRLRRSTCSVPWIRPIVVE